MLNFERFLWASIVIVLIYLLVGQIWISDAYYNEKHRTFYEDMYEKRRLKIGFLFLAEKYGK